MQPDQSAQFSPWYQAPINQGIAPTPYYNPFQGAHQQGIPVIDPPKEEEEVQQVVQQAVQKVRQESGDDRPSPQQIEAEARRIANAKWGGLTPPGILSGIGQAIGDYIKGGGIIGAILGGLSGKEPSGLVQTGGGFGPSQPIPGIGIGEFRAVRDRIGVTPTGQRGYGRGDLDPTSGGIFNEYGQAVDPETGEPVLNVHGTYSFASFQDWMDALASPGHGVKDVRYQGGTPVPGMMTPTPPPADRGGDSGGGPRYDPAAVQASVDYTQSNYEREAFGGSDRGNREGSGTGGRAESGEFVSSDHDWSANKGGYVMYRQAGGPIDPLAGATAGGQPAAQMPQPMQAGPQMRPRTPFAEKVERAKAIIKQNKSAGQPLPTPGMMDGQGDGPVFGDVTMAPGMVAPDVGPDTVDTKLTPGEFVVNAEAMENPENAAMVEAINNEGRMIQAMRGGGLVSRGAMYYNKGGETWDRQRFIRETLERIKPGTKDEAILLKKLGIDPKTYKQEGGVVEYDGASLDEWVNYLESGEADTRYDIQAILGDPNAPKELKDAAARIAVETGIYDTLDLHTKRIIDGTYTRDAGVDTGVADQSANLVSGPLGSRTPRGGYTANVGQELQDEVLVPVGADKYQNDPRYTRVSDDGSYRRYRLNPQALEAFTQFNQDTAMDPAAGQEAQYAQNQALIAQQDRDRERAYQLFTEDTALGEHVSDPQLDLAAETARREQNPEFRYLAGETYNAQSKEEALSWVTAGIVAKGAIFVLPDGTRGRAA